MQTEQAPSPGALQPENQPDTELLNSKGDVEPQNAGMDVKEEDEAASPASADKPVIEPIYYDLQPAPTADSVLKAKVNEERQKHLNRVKRFASAEKEVPLSRVTETSILGARRAAIRQGFATGFDTTSLEEQRKRQARLARFGPLQSHPFCRNEEDPSTLSARARRFSTAMQDTTALIADDALESKRVVAPGEAARDNVLHLHGVDQLSTKEVLKHFSQFGPSWCEWLNDSNCNIAFEDCFTLRRVLHRMSIASTPSGTPGQSMDAMQDRPEADAKAEHMTANAKAEPMAADAAMDAVGNTDTSSDLLFRPLRPFTRKGHVIPLWGRMATEADKRPEKPNPHSKWSRTISRSQQAKAEPAVGLSEKMASHSREVAIKKIFGVSKRRGNSISKKLKKKSTKMDIDRALSSS